MVLDTTQPIDRNSRTITTSRVLKQAFDNGANGPVYIGYAEPGALHSESKWQIVKLTYVTSMVTMIEFADGTEFFDKVWDDRASYTFNST